MKGRGRCLTHDVKLVREIKNMRMRLRESAVLICPAIHQDKQRSNHLMTSLPVSGGTANQNKTYKKIRMNDQSTSAGQDEMG